MFNSRIRAARLLLSFLIMLAAPTAGAEIPVPRLERPVMDQTGTLSSGARRTIEDGMYRLRDKYGLQLAVLIIPDLGGEAIEDLGIRVADAWKLGGSESDKGAILLVSLAEKKVRIEVGQGLEGDLPDALAKRIISERMAPIFQAGDFDGAITVGVYSIAQAALPNKDMSVYFRPTAGMMERHPDSRPLNLKEILILGFILGLALCTRVGRRILFFAMVAGGRGGYSGGGSRGGYRGGGGGFSGGGASGGW